MPAPRKRYRHRPLRRGSRISRATAVADSPELAAIARALTAPTGRPKGVPYRTAFLALVLHGIRGHDMWLTRITDSLYGLGREELDALGVNCKRPMNSIQEALAKLEAALNEGLELGFPDGTRRTMYLDDFTALVRLGIPPNHKVSKTVALDGMDYPTWARNEKYLDPKTGEVRASADPGAAIGHRTSTPNHENPWYCGYEEHGVTNATDPKGRLHGPHLMLAMTLRPGIKDRGPAGAAAVVRAAQHFGSTEVLVDRGYTQLAPANFWARVFEHGVHTVHDLVTNQRGARAASVPGVIVVDGHPFTAALPESLRYLTPPRLDDRTEDQTRARQIYDKRQPYAFTPHTRIDPKTGSQRFKGPALTGHVRCQNFPASMRLPRSRPLTNCRKGEKCACGKVITLPVGDDAHLRQPALYGSTAWKRRYNGRVAIESMNAEARVHRGNIERGFTRVHGLGRTAILLTFAYIGLNIRILNDWYDSRGLDDPWALLLGDPEDNRIRQEHANPERASIRDRLTAGTDPPLPRGTARS